LPRNLAKRLVAKPVPSEKKRPPISDTSDEEYQEKRPRKIAQNAVNSVQGKVFFRKDIGTTELIQKRVNHIRQLMQ